MTSAKQKCRMNIIEYTGVFPLVALGFSKQCPFIRAAFLLYTVLIFQISYISVEFFTVHVLLSKSGQVKT